MEIKWTPALRIGHDLIDSQHIELFSLFDTFVDGCAKGQGKDSLVELHKSLQDYVENHFSAEEALMENSKYPDIAHHRREHQKFRRDINDLKNTISRQGVTLMELVQTNKLLVNWLINHVQDVDQKLGNFLNDSGADDSPA